MNETRMASTAVERRTGTGDNCAGDERFTGRSYQSEDVKGPNPGKSGCHRFESNPNRVPVTEANMGPGSMRMGPVFPAERSSLRDKWQLRILFFFMTKTVATLKWSCLG